MVFLLGIGIKTIHEVYKRPSSYQKSSGNAKG
jgi:hypothetical protein